ncbi:MAG: hypothetical protein HQL59_06340 [Magnetococcales bacterium]|nr:hypothetical protein [Magnetococcales bacterium]
MSAMNAQLTEDGQTIIVRIPVSLRRQGGRRRIIIPEGANDLGLPTAAYSDALIQALARGFRWRKALESGDAASMRDLADAEKIDPSYMARLLRMTLLAPDIVEAILDGRQPEKMTMTVLANAFPARWDEQRTHFGFAAKVA